MRLFYTLAIWLATPFMLLHLVVKGMRRAGYLRRWNERFGFVPDPVAPGGIVVHAVSVGEVNAASPLVRELQRRRPELPLTLTCFTPTGSERITQLYGDEVLHTYAPFDTPGAVRRFLDHVRPRLIVILETEIWPNLYWAARQRGIPLMMANARISERSVIGYRRWKRLTTAALDAVSRIGAQSRKHAGRLLELGADPDRLEVTGNLKFDVRVPSEVAGLGQALRAEWGDERPVLIAGSTHDDDERVLVDAHRRILAERPDALMVLVPRHPERFNRGSGRLRQAGFHVARRSRGEPCTGETQLYLADTMGELLQLYAAGDVAFVGGSFGAVGGHNVLEPAALGRPVLVGPYTHGFAGITDRLLRKGGALRVEDAESLARAFLDLAGDPARCAEVGAAGRKLVDKGQGALERTLAMADDLLPPTEPGTLTRAAY